MCFKVDEIVYIFAQIKLFASLEKSVSIIRKNVSVKTNGGLKLVQQIWVICCV